MIILVNIFIHSAWGGGGGDKKRGGGELVQSHTTVKLQSITTNSVKTVCLRIFYTIFYIVVSTALSF